MKFETPETIEQKLERAKGDLVIRGIEQLKKDIHEKEKNPNRLRYWEKRAEFPQKWLAPRLGWGRYETEGEEPDLQLSISLSEEAINSEGKEKEELLLALKEHDFRETTFSAAETKELLESAKRDNPEGEEAFEKSQEARIGFERRQVGG